MGRPISFKIPDRLKLLLDTWKDMSLYSAAAVKPTLTLVTAFFDLAKREKTTRRPASEYLLHGQKLCEIAIPMVVFTDEEFVPIIREMRKKARHDLITRIVAFPFEQLPYFERRAQIERNRSTHKIDLLTPTKDTLNYQVLNWAKPWLVRRVIDENPFQSTHFMWHDFGLAHVAKMDSAVKDGVYSDLPDKIKYLAIRAPHKALLENWPEYFKTYHWYFGGGFFKGPRDKLVEFHAEFEILLDRILTSGYAPLDQEIFALVVHRIPQLFEAYYGDYAGMLENYRYLRRDVHMAVWYLREAIQFDNRDEIYALAVKTLDSAEVNAFGGSAEQLHQLLEGCFDVVLSRDRDLAMRIECEYERRKKTDASFYRIWESNFEHIAKSFSRLSS